jgi:UDP-glucose 4-epimerase
MLWPRHRPDGGRPPDRAAVPLRAQQVSRRAGGVPLAPGLSTTGERDPDLQRVRHAVADSGAYGAVFGVFLRQKLAGAPFAVVGDGTQRRDFVYATDVAAAFLRAAETERTGEAWNVGAGNPQSVNRLVELLGGEVVHLPKRPGEPDCTWADIGRITRELGWKPVVSFEEGVARVLAEIDYWREAPLWDAASVAEATRVWFDVLSENRR